MFSVTNPSDVAARPIQAGNESGFDRVGAAISTTGVVVVGSQQVTPHFHRAWQSPTPDGVLARSGAQRGQSIVLIFPAIFDGYAAALDEANLLKP